MPGFQRGKAHGPDSPPRRELQLLCEGVPSGPKAPQGKYRHGGNDPSPGLRRLSRAAAQATQQRMRLRADLHFLQPKEGSGALPATDGAAPLTSRRPDAPSHRL